MLGRHKRLPGANLRCVSMNTKSTVSAPGIAQQWPTLLMIKLGRITMHRFGEALEPFGIKPRHVAALIELRDRGELTQQSLCGVLHLDPTNLVAILNELEDRGYATRRRDPADRRRHIVQVSAKGLKVIDKVTEVMGSVEDELLADFTAAEREQVAHLLTAIWNRSGGHEAYSQAAAEAEDKAA